MASTIRIKRSETAGAPASLKVGELAYSNADPISVAGGGRLYVGVGGVDSEGNANGQVIIGGKFFTDMLDHGKGTLTPDSALIVDSNSKIDVLNVDNITINGNSITSTNSNGDIVITPDGSGKTVVSNLFIGSDSITEFIQDVTGGQLIAGEGIDITYDDNAGTTTIDAEIATTSNRGVASFEDDDFVLASGAVSLADTVVKTISTDSGTLTPASHSFSILGGEGMNVTHAGANITVTGEDATSSNKGIASFSSDDFAVTSGAVTIKTGGVTNAQLANDSITIGSTTIALGATSTTLEGVTNFTVDNLNLNSNTITATNTNGSVVLIPDGTGTVDVSSKRITSVAAPTDPTDAANKEYVDEVAQGLHALPSAEAATTADLNATYNSGTNTLTGNANGALVVDGYTLLVGENVLVKDQANAWENGSYVVVNTGDGSNPFVITRCDFCNETSEVPGAFEFVTAGSVYGNTGWVATVPDGFTLNATDGSGDITWVQFSGAGTFTAGNGLELDGTEFNVLLSTTGGLEFTGSNEVGLKANVGGAGLVNTDGVLDVVGTTNRISVTADAIDIASTYVGQTSITTLGTIGTGTWQGSVISPTYGGTGVDNGSSTFTLGGNVEFSGAFSATLTVTGATSVTLPTTGTLATLAGTETLTNKTINNSDIGTANPGTGAFTTLGASGLVTFTDTSEASSVSTGTLVVGGGVGIAKSLYVGLDIVGTGVETSSISGFDIDGGTY